MINGRRTQGYSDRKSLIDYWPSTLVTDYLKGDGHGKKNAILFLVWRRTWNL